MMHRVFGLLTQSVALIADKGNNHAVEVEEEHKEVEAKLDEGFLNTISSQSLHCGLRLGNPTDLLVHVQLAENLGRIQKVLVLVDPICPKTTRLAVC
jgi:hypothetical protein